MDRAEGEASVSPAFDVFQRGWQAEFGDGIPLPAFTGS
jgi:hypothetical protein